MLVVALLFAFLSSPACILFPFGLDASFIVFKVLLILSLSALFSASVLSCVQDVGSSTVQMSYIDLRNGYQTEEPEAPRLLLHLFFISFWLCVFTHEDWISTFLTVACCANMLHSNHYWKSSECLTLRRLLVHSSSILARSQFQGKRLNKWSPDIFPSVTSSNLPWWKLLWKVFRPITHSDKVKRYIYIYCYFGN